MISSFIRRLNYFKMSINFQKLFETAKEYPERVLADVQGKIPSWIKGTLLKNGPGIFEIGTDKYNHWFDGLAVMQSFHIEDGKVYHSSKYLRSNAYKQNMASQRIVVGEFGTMAYPDPCKNIFQRYFSYFFSGDLTDNGLVNFMQCGDEIYACTETAIMNKIDPKTLDTIEQVDLRKYVATNIASAHPHYDRQGNAYNMGSAFSSRDYPSYTIILTPNPLNEPTKGSNAIEKSRIVANIPTKSAYLSYFHSFGKSENYIILPEMPLVMNPFKFMTAPFTRTPFSNCMEWHMKKTVFHVVGIADSQLSKVKYTADGFFSFHHVNAFESDNCLIVDLVTYKDGTVIQNASMENARKGNFSESNSESGSLCRFVFPIEIPSDAKSGDNLLASKNFKTTATAILQDDGTVHCTRQLLSDKFVELPRINYEKCNGLPYQFCYFGGKSENKVYFLDELYKIDVNSGETNTWSRDHSGQFVGEPVFVPRPGSIDEDDGVILSPITDVVNEERNFLLVLDGKTFKEIARAHVNRMIPLGIHGHFVEEKN